MALGTGPQRLVELIEDKWQESRTGRGDIPSMIQYQTGSDDPRLNSGVLVLQDREKPFVDQGKHDLIHVYHPEGAPPTMTDQGYKETNIVETVQVDIILTDRTDQSTDQRLEAKDRMVGDRADVSDPDEPPYPGIWGEMRYILETVRRGLEEWDTVSQEPINVYLGSSNANVSINVELEQIATNTVQ